MSTHNMFSCRNKKIIDHSFQLKKKVPYLELCVLLYFCYITRVSLLEFCSNITFIIVLLVC